MTRLTNATREAIALDLLKLKFTERGNSLLLENAALFDAVYRSHYERQIIKAMERLIAVAGTKALERSSCFDCRTPEARRVKVGTISFGKCGLTFTGKVTSRSIINDDRYNVWDFTCGEIGDRLLQFSKDQQAFELEITQSHREVLAALGSITTAKQLKELWPEALPFLEKHIAAAPKANLPAVQFQHLNATFGLPIEVAA